MTGSGPHAEARPKGPKDERKANAEGYLQTDTVAETPSRIASAVPSRPIVTPAAPETPPDLRSDKDYAIEHGGYLADAAQAYLDEKNRYDMAVAKYSDEVPDTDSLSDHHSALRDAIYEFRKRAKRAGTPRKEEA